MVNALSEVDMLRLELMKERDARLQSDGQRLHLQLQHAVDLYSEHRKAHDVFLQQLRSQYELAPGDEILTDGTIKRAVVRAIKQEETAQ